MKTRLVAVATLISVLSVFPAMAQEAGGFGTNIPLELAVRQIVPDGTTVQLADGVDGKTRVSWDGSAGWRKSLEQAASGAGYIVTSTGDTVTIARAGATVEQAPKSDTSAAKPAAAGKKPVTPKTPKKKPAAKAAVVEMPVVNGSGFVLIPETATDAKGNADGWNEYPGKGGGAPAIAEWVVQPGDDLNVVLADWSEKTGWRLVWESEYIYKLTSAAKFRGDFVTATTELLRSMQDARPAITAQFYQGNKVLVVGNGNLDEVN